MSEERGDQREQAQQEPQCRCRGDDRQQGTEKRDGDVTAPSRLRGPGDGVIAPSKSNPGFRSQAVIVTCAISLAVPGVSRASH
jgi:hypothetical protein